MTKHKTQLLSFLFKKLKNIIILSGFILIVFIVGIVWITNKANSLDQQISELEQKNTTTNTSVDPNSLSLFDDKSEIIANFMPDSFNVWQMVKLIDVLEERTKFTIGSYNLREETDELDVLQKQSLQLDGSGTLTEFFAFLKEYKYITGQIITIDSVNLVGNEEVFTKLSVNTYAYNPDIDLTVDGVEALEKQDRKILDKLKKFNYQRKKLVIEDDYEAAENPFE